MSTSTRAQELADQLLGLEATRAVLPVERRRFQGMDSIKSFVLSNKKLFMVAAVVVGAVVVVAGVKEYQKKHPKQ